MQTHRTEFYLAHIVSTASMWLLCCRRRSLQVGMILLVLLSTGQDVLGQEVTWVKTTLNDGATGGVGFLAQLPSGGIFAGTFHSIFLSTDLGRTWVEKSNGLPAQSIVSIAILPTGDAYVVANKYLYRSTNSGTTWAMDSTGYDYGSFTCVGYGPTTGLLVGSYGSGILKSTDAGISWSGIYTLENPYVDLFFYDSSGAVYAATNPSINGKALYRSTDGGNSWTAILGGYLAVRAFASRSSGAIYIGGQGVGGSGPEGPGVLRTTNYGATWDTLNTGLQSPNISGFAIGGADTLFATSAWDGPGIYRTVDGGGHWETKSVGISESYVWCILQTPANELFVGAENTGVYRSLDRAEHWTCVSKALTSQVIRSLVSTTSGVLLVGTEGDGIFLSTDQGETWSIPASGLGSESVWTLARDSSGHVFAGTSTGIYRSSDGGSNWASVYGIPPGDAGGFIISIAAGPDGFIYAAERDYRLLRSTDAGLSWQTLTNAPTDRSYYPIIATRDNVIVLGTLLGGLYRSTDSGLSWLPADNLGGMTSASIYSMVADYAGDVFAGGSVTSPPFYSLYKSTDQGRVWNACLMSGDIYALAANSRDAIFAGGDISGGVFRSLDAGASWLAIGPLNATALSVDPQGFLYAGGGGGYLHRSSESTTGVGPGSRVIPLATAMSQNYPNPFNPKTVVSYQLSVVSSVRLVVYDILGREVAVLVNERKAPGTYSVEFDASNLASGVYLYRLSAGTYIETRKMVLMK